MKKHRLYEGAGSGYDVTLKDVVVFSGKKEDILDVDVNVEKIGNMDYLFLMIKTKIPAQNGIDWSVKGYDYSYSSEYDWNGVPWDGRGDISGGVAVIPLSISGIGGRNNARDFAEGLIKAGFDIDEFIDYKQVEKEKETDMDVILDNFDYFMDHEKVANTLNKEHEKCFQIACEIFLGFVNRYDCSELSNNFGGGFTRPDLDENGIELEGEWLAYEDDCVCLVKGDIIKVINYCYDAMIDEE